MGDYMIIQERGILFLTNQCTGNEAVKAALACQLVGQLRRGAVGLRLSSKQDGRVT